MKRRGWSGYRPPIVVLGIAAYAAITVLAWHDYATAVAWQRSSALIVERSADEALELLATAYTRDMRAGLSSVLLGVQASDLGGERIHEVRSEAASAFATFPYLETLYVWRPGVDPELVFFYRAERRPSWASGPGSPAVFPVEVQEGGEVPRDFARHVREVAARGEPFSASSVVLDARTYQVVTRYFYSGEVFRKPVAAVGFTVDTDWARAHYLPEIARTIVGILPADRQLSVRIADAGGRELVRLGAPPEAGSIRRRRLPLLFADPLKVDRTDRAGMEDEFSVEVGIAAGEDLTRVQASRSSQRMAFFSTSAAVGLGVAFILAVRAARTQSNLAKLRLDFVSTVTHNIKTPIASIRILGEALARRGSSTPPADTEEYGQLLVQQTRQLSRLIDNLLAYSRVSDVREAYTFEPLAIDTLVEKALAGFRQVLVANHFTIEVDLPDDLPDIRGDATALGLVLDNLIDNAIRYSGERTWIGIAAKVSRDHVSLTVSDHGDGIPPEELSTIPRRFHRGRDARSEGSGLGLALAQQIVRDHGGALRLGSVVGAGTEVTVDLPVA